MQPSPGISRWENFITRRDKHCYNYEVIQELLQGGAGNLLQSVAAASAK